MQPTPHNHHTRTFLIACVLVLMPLCFLGYGSDNDTYTVLDSGVSTWHLHLPETSRNPGYWVFEAIVYGLRHGGESLATNLATLCVAMVILWRFLAMARRLKVKFPFLVTGSLVATPVFAIASTSTVDYVWSLLGIVLFVEFLLADRLLLAIVPAAFALAIRAANAPLIVGAIAGAIVFAPRRAIRLIGVGLAAGVLGCLPMVESYRLANHTVAFTHAVAGPDSMWSATMRTGRFVYKSIYLFGPIASVLLAAGQLRLSRDVAPGNPDYRRQAISIFFGIIVANELLFLRYPIEISYLIPSAFFVLLCVGTQLERRWHAMAILFAVLSLDVMTPQFAQPNIPGRATSARLHFSLEPGMLIDDIRMRIKVRQCEDYRCYYLALHPGSHALDASVPMPIPTANRAPVK